MKNKDVNYRLKKVFLKFYEVAMGKFIADLRMSESKKLNLKERFTQPMSESHNKEINYLGALGEIATAKYLNQYWGGTVNTFHSLADVGLTVDVRTTKRSDQSLIIRNKDDESNFYFLVIQLSQEAYRIAGFIKGTDGKNEKYWGSPNERPPAYFIPQSDLIKPTLENLRKAGLMV